MSQPHRKIASSLIASLLCTGLLITTGTASAGYTVINEDLLPTVFTEVAAPAHYLVAFPKNAHGLSDQGRNMLDAVLPMMRGASIRIVGRPDAMVRSSGKLALLASNRANSIRNYLTRQGIAYESITVEIDNTPNPQANGSLYPTDIYVTRSADRAARQPQASAPQIPAQFFASPVAYAPRPSPAPAPLAPSAGAARDRLVQYINQAVMSGQMEPAVALKLLRSQMESERGDAPATAPALVQARMDMPPVAPITYAQPTVAPAPVSTWVLDKRLSLRENIDAWSRLAGWSPTAWEATGAFQITADSHVAGDFPGVLRQIADSTGLNICAKTREKIVRVTDANVSCK